MRCCPPRSAGRSTRRSALRWTAAEARLRSLTWPACCSRSDLGWWEPGRAEATSREGEEDSKDRRKRTKGWRVSEEEGDIEFPPARRPDLAVCPCVPASTSS